MIQRAATTALILFLATHAFAQPATQPVVRCAVINGMNITGFWQAVSERFERETGIKVETVAFGEKEIIDEAFRKGEIDLITMHASDKIINLVADGLAMDPQPWVRNDLVIVGPPGDPARIKGLTDAGEAFCRIAASKSQLVVHASLGAQGVLRAIVDEAGIAFDPNVITMLFDDQQREVLRIAAEKNAYTMIGRIPFRIGRIPNAGLELMVQGDDRLRRPYVVAVANPAKVQGARVAPARRLAAYLRLPQTQEWIAEWGKGQLDDRSVFFPVTVAGPTSRPARSLAQVSGEIGKPLDITADLLKTLPRTELRVKNEAGIELHYSGVTLREVLKAADVPVGNQFRPVHTRLTVIIGASDGYEASFSLTEFVEGFTERLILLADQKDGKPLAANEGPLRLIVPNDGKQARWVRQVNRIEIK